ncbi:hypothetical protein BDV98DRAFT_190842 [Pterulicium gracile]|uniref:Uncharacterized protein n=1 Tax=Pterulicium gracile TaxID=1884261 RepID=A0A5C3QEU3_9AGAR|nr:hypothetical protein BDV98DRAFT_190842 [Pterula gracilis]
MVSTAAISGAAPQASALVAQYSANSHNEPTAGLCELSEYSHCFQRTHRRNPIIRTLTVTRLPRGAGKSASYPGAWSWAPVLIRGARFISLGAQPDVVPHGSASTLSTTRYCRLLILNNLASVEVISFTE